MFCCSYQEHPSGFKAVPHIEATHAFKPPYKKIFSNLAAIRACYDQIPDQYSAHRAARLLCIAGLAVTIIVTTAALAGTFSTLPYRLLSFVKTINWIQASQAGSILALLSTGAGVIIHRVRQKRDLITQSGPGVFKGDHHWLSAVYTTDDSFEFYFAGYIDTSVLDEEKTGKAYMYVFKDPSNQTAVSLAVTITTPLHMAAAMTYNIVKLALLPIYILGCLLIEKYRGAPLDPHDRAFEWQDIPKETCNTLYRIVKAPFYATAIIFSALYSFIDPLNGRKLGAALELEWNDNVSRAEGFWSVNGPQSLWQYEGGGSPSGLGRNGFYLAGCWQPIAVVTFEKGKIVSASSLSKAISSKKGKDYKIYTVELLQEKHNALVSELEKMSAPPAA